MDGPESNGLLRKVEDHVTELLASSLPAWAVYHGLEHTRETVKAARTIAQESGIPRKDLETVLIAAWFHDVGFIQGSENHEGRSAQAARDYLSSQDVPRERIEAVAACIHATRLPQQPHTIAEQILCDADIIHVGKKRFFDKSALLRSEMELLKGRPFMEQEWLTYNLNFVTGHSFHTAYAQRQLARRRSKNLLILQERFRSLSLDEEQRRARRTKKEERSNISGHGIETMFRVVPKNHLDFIALADQRATIMISTNALIMVIAFGLLVTNLGSSPHLMLPTFLLLGVCLAALSAAILATRPHATAGTFTREEIRSKRANLLSFGNFHRSSLEDFEWGMHEMMKDREYLHGSMIKDLHNLGKALGAKHRYLRLSYSVFLYGMILVVLSFVGALLTLTPLVQ